jgi:hypothetical protein
MRGQDQQKHVLCIDIRSSVETQRGIVRGNKICSINTQVPNFDESRSSLDMNFSRFKDLTMLGTCSMPYTHSTLNNIEIVVRITIGKSN